MTVYYLGQPIEMTEERRIIPGIGWWVLCMWPFNPKKPKAKRDYWHWFEQLKIEPWGEEHV